jgi:hypothetical protein
MMGMVEAELNTKASEVVEALVAVKEEVMMSGAGVAQHESKVEMALEAVVVAEITVNRGLTPKTFKIVEAEGVEKSIQVEEESARMEAGALWIEEEADSRAPEPASMAGDVVVEAGPRAKDDLFVCFDVAFRFSSAAMLSFCQPKLNAKFCYCQMLRIVVLHGQHCNVTVLRTNYAIYDNV